MKEISHRGSDTYFRRILLRKDFLLELLFQLDNLCDIIKQHLNDVLRNEANEKAQLKARLLLIISLDSDFTKSLQDLCLA